MSLQENHKSLHNSVAASKFIFKMLSWKHTEQIRMSKSYRNKLLINADSSVGQKNFKWIKNAQQFSAP